MPGFPVSNEDYQDLKDAVEKLSLSDSALQFEPENSPVPKASACGLVSSGCFMDIIRERLEREYDLDLVVTNRALTEVSMTDGTQLDIKVPARLPDVSKITEIREPWIRGEIVVPQDYVGAVIQLIVSKRGLQTNLSYIDQRSLISFFKRRWPICSLIFMTSSKSVTSGYGSSTMNSTGIEQKISCGLILRRR